MYVDGRSPPCDDPWSQNAAIAFHCDDRDLKQDHFGEWYQDVWNGDIYFDTNGQSWTFGGAAYDPSDPTFSFRGYLVHELGHGAGLGQRPDNQCASGSQRQTMCPEFSMSESFHIDSLTADDEDSGDRLYLP